MLHVQERKREMQSERWRRRKEEEGGGCYVTLGSANLLIMLLMFMSENFYGCFV